MQLFQRFYQEVRKLYEFSNKRFHSTNLKIVYLNQACQTQTIVQDAQWIFKAKWLCAGRSLKIYYIGFGSKDLLI